MLFWAWSCLTLNPNTDSTHQALSHQLLFATLKPHSIAQSAVSRKGWKSGLPTFGDSSAEAKQVKSTDQNAGSAPQSIEQTQKLSIRTTNG